MTLDHEATHALFSVLTGGRPRSLHVGTRGDGLLQHSGSRLRCLVALAPYFFPTSTAALLLVATFVPRPWPIPLVGVIAASLGYHLASDATEARPRQPDIRQNGGWLALVAILGLWCTTLPGVLGSLVFGPSRVVHDVVAWLRHA